MRRATNKHMRHRGFCIRLASIALAWLFLSNAAAAADISVPGLEINLDGGRTEVATALKILLGLTVLSLVPALLITATAFTRIVIILSMLRHAFGTQETPPNTVLISLALFLTLFTMMPVFTEINDRAFQPYTEGRISAQRALDRGIAPLRDFMIRQTREQDLALMIEVSKGKIPEKPEDVSNVQLIPAFMLSELKTSFQIGFVIFLPFLLIDLVVASILMSMGMLMVPPMMISLPIKILMFVLIDGWNLVAKSLVTSFH